LRLLLLLLQLKLWHLLRKLTAKLPKEICEKLNFRAIKINQRSSDLHTNSPNQIKHNSSAIFPINPANSVNWSSAAAIDRLFRLYLVLCYFYYYFFFLNQASFKFCSRDLNGTTARKCFTISFL